MKQVWPIRPPEGRDPMEAEPCLPEERFLGIQAMEHRLEAQGIEGCLTEVALCVWYACTLVCPPGG